MAVARFSKPLLFLKLALFLAIALLIVVVSLLFIGLRPVDQLEHTKLKLHGTTYHIVIASTPAERERGLSGTDQLASNTGMLFTFSEPDAACFWMKDMNYSLDILWFDAKHKLVYEQQDLSPQTYPQTYCPPQAALTVLELPAGTIASTGVQLGDEYQLNH